MTVKTISALKADIATDLADNSSGDISAGDVRGSCTDIVDSLGAVSGWGSYNDTQYTSGSQLSVSAGVATKLPNNAGTIIDSQKPVDVPAFYTPNSIKYDNGTDSFTVGETITGGTSGATAVIVAIEGDATSGFLFLSSVSGTFVDNEALTSAGGSALVNGTLSGGKILGRNGDGLALNVFFYATPSAANQSVDVYIDITDGTGSPANLAKIYPDTNPFPKGSGVEMGVNFAVPAAYTLNTWQANGGNVYVQSASNFTLHGVIFNFARTHKAI